MKIDTLKSSHKTKRKKYTLSGLYVD